MTNLLQKRW